MRVLSLLAVLTMGGAALAAEPVLVPEFHSVNASEFALAAMMQDQVQQKLVDSGLIVLGSEHVSTEVGDAAVYQCAVNPTCPGAVLPRLPVRVALVVSVARQGEILVGHMEIWEQSRPTPIDVRDIPINPGNEHLFVHEVTTATTQWINQLEPSSDAVLMAAARLLAGQGAAAPIPQSPAPAAVQPYPGQPAAQPYPAQPAAQPYPTQPAAQPYPAQPAAQPYPTQPAAQPYPAQPAAQPYPAQPAAQGQPYPAQPAAPYPPQAQPQPAGGGTLIDLEPDVGGGTAKPPVVKDGSTNNGKAPVKTGGKLEGTGVKPRHLVGSERHFENSGLDVRDWLYKNMPHAGRMIVEVNVGMGLGDVDRAADVRVELLDGAQLADWYQEGPLAARRPRGAIFLGYAPATFLDLGVRLGLQYSERTLTTGWYRANTGAAPDIQTSDPQQVQAVQFFTQPRMRGYLVPVGPAKPFLFIGADIRVFDRYQIAQPESITYIIPEGGVVPGVVGGGGMMIDPGPIVGFFAEGSYIRHFGLRAAAVQNAEWPYNKPEAPAGSQSTVTVTGGIQFRL